jgi:PadR family transcriptional regulator PadR
MAQLDRAALTQWEEIYKRGLLTFWILLLLNEREMYAYEMRPSIADISQGTIDVDDNSIYRALKRFAEAGYVRSDLRASEAGPARRYFTLAPAGRALLAGFIERNLLLFQSPQVVASMQRVLEQHHGKVKENNGD